MNQISFKNGPSLRVSIDASLRVFLTPSSCFELQSETSLPKIVSWLDSYSRGIVLPLPAFLHFDPFTPFIKAVYNALIAIPFGEVVTYQQIAAKIGSSKAARAVGSACGKNPFLLFVPCHRVITSSGGLGGFAQGGQVKQTLLSFERELKNS